MSSFVPCSPDGRSSWSQITDLDGVSFVLRFAWSQREGRWVLDLADAEGTTIRSGLALVADQPLLRGIIDTRRPGGELLVVDTMGANDRDPGFDDIGAPGARFVFMYVTAAELAA